MKQKTNGIAPSESVARTQQYRAWNGHNMRQLASPVHVRYASASLSRPTLCALCMVASTTGKEGDPVWQYI